MDSADNRRAERELLVHYRDLLALNQRYAGELEALVAHVRTILDNTDSTTTDSLSDPVDENVPPRRNAGGEVGTSRTEAAGSSFAGPSLVDARTLLAGGAPVKYGSLAAPSGSAVVNRLHHHTLAQEWISLLARVIASGEQIVLAYLDTNYQAVFLGPFAFEQADFVFPLSLKVAVDVEEYLTREAPKSLIPLYQDMHPGETNRTKIARAVAACLWRLAVGATCEKGKVGGTMHHLGSEDEKSVAGTAFGFTLVALSPDRAVRLAGLEHVAEKLIASADEARLRDAAAFAAMFTPMPPERLLAAATTRLSVGGSCVKSPGCTRGNGHRGHCSGQQGGCPRDKACTRAGHKGKSLSELKKLGGCRLPAETKRARLGVE